MSCCKYFADYANQSGHLPANSSLTFLPGCGEKKGKLELKCEFLDHHLADGSTGTTLPSTVYSIVFSSTDMVDKDESIA